MGELLSQRFAGRLRLSVRHSTQKSTRLGVVFLGQRVKNIDNLMIPATLFGSFITAKAEPNDIDILLLMEDTFDLSAVTGEAAVVFQHLEAHARFGASIFWTRRSGALGGEQAMIEYWQVRREGGQRGIVEILPEGT
jgi:hypothetical protein